jgi:pimeloyl-ACP methyl ester carboxylesterase
VATWILALAIVLAGGAAILALLRRPAPRDASIDVDRRLVYVQNTALHVVDRGEGRSVVFLQGDDGDASDFMAPLLARVAYDFRALLIDRPGCGGSDRVRHDSTLDAQARLIRLALRELGAEHPLLVAHSWSAIAALALALRYPDDFSGLVLVNPLCYADASIRATDPHLRVVSRIGSLVAPMVGRTAHDAALRAKRSCPFASPLAFDARASDAALRAIPWRSAPPRGSSRATPTSTCPSSSSSATAIASRHHRATATGCTIRCIIRISSCSRAAAT